MTETAPVISLAHPERPRPGSVGEPLPGVEVRVVDEDGNPVEAGEDGEVHVRGRNVMLGYHKRPDLTQEVLLDDGWLRTGDRGRFDPEGFLYITGRQKDLIITGGENVSPREVEEILLTHPEVVEAAVVGTPDASRGEVIAAYVVREENSALNENELRTFCREHLAGFKTPRIVHFVGELPRNYAGKVLKRKLPS